MTMWSPFKWLAVAMSDARDSRDDELVLAVLSNAWGQRWQTALEIRAIAGISRPRATAALLRLQNAGEVHEREGYWATPTPESWNPAADDAKDAGLSNVVPMAPDALKARMLNVLGAGKESAIASTAEPKTALTNEVRGDYTDLKPNGQQKAYLVLSAEERAKGFVRPVRRTYVHVGRPVVGVFRDLSAEEAERYSGSGYVRFEDYRGAKGSVIGKFWTQADFDRMSCGTETTMSQDIAETYARDPHFYGGTFCVACGRHFPVGEAGEFVWKDNPDQRVGT